MKTVLKQVAIALAFCLALVGLSVTPASAYPSDCNSGGYICFYSDTAGHNMISKTAATIYPKSICWPLSGQENNNIGYISNPSSSSFVVYLNGSCSETSAPVYAHSYGGMNITWNHTISSLFRA
jgi:hypothetical protein